MKTDVFSVKELTRKIKLHIDSSPELKEVWVRAEISNFTHHSRGHMYFTLKDEAARISAVMFAGNNRYLKFSPKNGLKVIVRGEVSVYERSGQYQLYVKEMQPDGIGALYQAFEDLKKKLSERGWFAEENKKPIPKIPRKIGVITSPTGAAIRDILITLQRRFPVADIVVFPVLVQGEQAAPSVVKAIQLAHQEEGIEVIIVGRGGGSIEELWAFNEEMVVEAIHHSTLPVISAVGHETDFTIADFVADLRAPTPTAAAELSVPLLSELNHRIEQAQDRLKKALYHFNRDKRKALDRLRHSYAFKYPQQLVVQHEQELDHKLQQLHRNIKRVIEQRKLNHSHLKRQLVSLYPKERLLQAQLTHQRTHEQLKREMKMKLEGLQKDLSHRASQLDAVSPLKIMTKGYSLVYNQDKTELYKSVRHVEPGQAISVKMKDGELDCHVWGIKEGDRYE